MSNQGRLDAKTLRYMAENAAVEHTLLTPFRWLIGLGKTIIYILLAISWLLFTVGGWVFNVGEYSLENRREAVCDARAYVHICDPYEFNATNPHEDDVWNLRHLVIQDDVRNTPDVRLLDDPNTLSGIAIMDPGETNTATKPWISFSDSEFFMRGNDVFRRKSVQMDQALADGGRAGDTLLYAISVAKNIEKEQVRLPDAPVIVLRQGVIPADALGTTTYVTWGMCLKQECAADGSDLNYALFWGDVLWTRPALSKHQQNAVDALESMGTLPFWLQEFHANGIQDDALIREQFREFQHDRKDEPGHRWSEVPRVKRAHPNGSGLRLPGKKVVISVHKRLAG